MQGTGLVGMGNGSAPLWLRVFSIPLAGFPPVVPLQMLCPAPVSATQTEDFLYVEYESPILGVSGGASTAGGHVPCFSHSAPTIVLCCPPASTSVPLSPSRSSQFIDDVEFWFKPGPGFRVEYRRWVVRGGVCHAGMLWRRFVQGSGIWAGLWTWVDSRAGRKCAVPCCARGCAGAGGG